MNVLDARDTAACNHWNRDGIGNPSSKRDIHAGFHAIAGNVGDNQRLSDQGERLGQGQLIGLKSASRGGAIGETSLMVLAMTNGGAEKIAGADLAAILEALIALEAEDIARDLAIEWTGFWKPAA